MRASVLILTLNEEVNLPGCLESVKWCDDVVVFDSFSSDRTEQIARDFGARFVQRRFDNYSRHRNWARENIDYRHRWAFSLDADERMTSELRDEVAALPEAGQGTGGAIVAYRMRYKNMFLGRWIKRSSFYPTWLIRLFRPERVVYEDRSVNAHPIVHGELGTLEHHFEHVSFNKGFGEWFEKHNRYSTMEAEECLKQLQSDTLDLRRLFARDPLARRRALKELSFRLPLRPWLKFGYMYFLRMGFLDGRPGLTYCALQAFYEYMICLKMRELQRREHNLPL